MVERFSRRQRLAALVGALAVIALTTLGPIVNQDSATYLRGAIFRPPLLPALAAALRAVLGATWGLYGLVAVQASGGFVTAAALATALCAVAEAPAAWWFVLAALAFPQLQAARTVMSESLAYTALCGGLAHSIRALSCPRRSDIVGIAAYGAALLAARAQFVFCVPLAVVAAAFFLVRVDRTTAERGRTVGALLFVAVAALVLQASYTLPRSASLRPVPFTGIQLVILTTYVAAPSDVAHIRDPEARDLAQAVYDRVKESGWLAGQEGRLTTTLHFGIEYNLILDAYIDEFDRRIGRHVLTSRSQEDLLDHFRIQDWVDLDRVTLQISRELLRTVWLRYAKLVVTNIFQGARYLFLTALFVFGLTVSSFVRRARTAPALAAPAVLITGLWLVNAGFVALLEPLQTRYTFYFDSALLALFVATVGSVLANVRSSCAEAPNMGD